MEFLGYTNLPPKKKISKIQQLFMFNPFTLYSAKSKIDEFSKITNGVKLKNKLYYSKVLLNSCSMNGHTLGFCP